MKRRLAVTGLFILALLVFSGCTKQEAAPEEAGAAYETVLNVAVMQESPSLDLHKNSTLIARQIGSGSIWEKLVTLNAASEVVPELAERFEMSDDGTALTFYLRQGVKFHDGQIMDADDVRVSMNRWIEGFSVAKELAGPSRFEKIDDFTVRIQFDHPAVTFPDVMAGAAQPAIITTQEAAADEDDKGFMKQNIGTGPFKFVEWKLGQYILLEKFADYVPYGDPSKPVDGWAGYKAPQLEQIYFHLVSQGSTRIAGLETGQFHVDYNVGDDELSRLSALDNAETISYQAGTLALIFNKKQGVASNIYFRQAVNAACGNEDILRAIYGTQYDLGSSYMDDTQPYWKSDAGSGQYNRQDSDLAKELLKKADYRGETFHILTPILGTIERGIVVLEQQLEAVGINVEVTTVDWATMMQYRTDPARFDLYITSFVSVPVPSLKLYFGPSYPGWSDDPLLQQYLADFNQATSREEARRRWDVLQEYSWEYLPIINVGHFSSTFAWNKRLENITVYNGLFFWNTRIKK
ncbi:MAG: ABC transporter substrate-binding protein [Treponema sp.]|jgi:peptide/nickel transport system substrate-binding protein|nr:ABC transporter substrate-binding protein [Treponema sp.]